MRNIAVAVNTRDGPLPLLPNVRPLCLWNLSLLAEFGAKTCNGSLENRWSKFTNLTGKCQMLHAEPNFSAHRMSSLRYEFSFLLFTSGLQTAVRRSGPIGERVWAVLAGEI